MARYTYNAGLVTQTLDKLYSACDALDSTNVDIKKGIDMINSARGAENIDIDFTPITGYQSSVIDYIETMAKEIKGKAQEIEEYQDAPWYKKLFATIGMGALKLVEGLATFVEQIGDGLVSIVGFIGGIFSSDFRDCIGEFVKKDWVGDTTAKWYEEGWLKSVNKYSIMSHESTCANVFKGFGVAAGYVVLSVCTAGAGTAVSLGVSAAAAAAGGIGSGTQSGLQAGMTFNQAFGQGVKQGAVAAATTLVIGGIANKLTAGARATTALNSMDELSSAANSTKNAMNTFKALANSSDEMAGLADDVAKLSQYADDVANMADDAVQIGGTTVKNASNTLKSAKDLAKQAQNLKAAAQAAGAGDDVLNSLDDVITQANKAADVAKATKAAVAGAQGTEAVTSEGNKVTNALANSKAGQAVGKITSKAGSALSKSKIGQAATNLASKAANSKVGQVVTNLATKAGPVTTNAIAAGAGAMTGGMPSAPSADATFKKMYGETPNPSPGEQLAEESVEAIKNNLPSVNENPQTNSENNTTSQPSSIKDETPQSTKITPKPTNPQPTKITPRPTTPQPTRITPRPSTPQPTRVTPDSTTPRPTSTTPRFTQKQDDIIRTLAPTNKPSYVNDTVSKNSSASGVLDTFGQVSGSLSDITGTSTSIPTSSSPILSSDGGNSGSGKSMLPLGAGLGAAALAGIGTKAYLDKKEKKEEDSDELETEEWANQDVEIDYGLDTGEEADYLDPTDEFAFQE